jgi:hypothetical protein
MVRSVGPGLARPHLRLGRQRPDMLRCEGAGRTAHAGVRRFFLRRRRPPGHLPDAAADHRAVTTPSPASTPA